MAKRVEFQFTKKDGLTEKGAIKRLSRAMARSLEAKGLGKIIGDVKTARELETIEEFRNELEQGMDDKIVAVKKESDTKVAKAEAAAKKATELAEAKVKKSSEEQARMKTEMAKSKKELAASVKMQQATQNKLDKLVQQRATK